MDAGFFKGTSADQDNRFVDKNKKLMKTMKFGEGLEKKVDMSRVDMEIIRPWINQTITNYLKGNEDDVLFEFICNQLDDPLPDGRQMQVNLAGFLGSKEAREFMQKLWQLLASAMDDICGIPEELKEQKKEQIRIKQEEQGRITETMKSHQIMIQEAIAKIKVNAAAAAINSRNFSDHSEKPPTRGRLTLGLSRSRSPRNARVNTKDSDAGNAKLKAGDRSDDPLRKTRIDEDKRRRQGSYGRNRMHSPSPHKDRRRSREQSPYRKSSPRRHSRSPDPSRRHSPSPRRSKALQSRHRSRQRKSLSPGHQGARLSRHQPSHDDGQHRVLPDTPSKRSQGRSGSSGSQRLRNKRSRSKSAAAENARDGKTLEKLSVFQHRNYRSHEGGRRSTPEDAGPSPKKNNPRRSRNGHRKSFSPPLPARNDFSPQRKRSPRYSSPVAHRRYPPSPRQNPLPEGDTYSKLEPVYPARRLSLRPSHSRSQRRSLSLSPGRRAKDQLWVNDRRRVSPRSSHYGFHDMPHPGDNPPEIRRNQNVSPGYRDNWGPTSKWDGVDSRQRSPMERPIRSPPIERRRISPFPDRYAGLKEPPWPSPRGEYRDHAGAPRYEQPLDDFDRGGVNAFGREISHRQQRRGKSPFRGTALLYGSDVREPVVEYYPDFPPARGSPPRLGPPSSPMGRHSRAYPRTFSPQRRDSYEPRGGHHGDRYPIRSHERTEDRYDPSGDKLNPHFVQHGGSSYDRVGEGYGVDRHHPRGGGGHTDDVRRALGHLRDNDLPRTDPRRYPNQHSRSSQRSKSSSGPGSPVSPRSPRWSDGKARNENVVEESERERRGVVASRTGFTTNKGRTEEDNSDVKYGRASHQKGSRSLKRERSTTSSSPEGLPRSSNRQRSPSGGVDRQEASADPYVGRRREEGNFEDVRGDRRTNRTPSPSSPLSLLEKRMKVEGEGVISAEGSEVEISGKKKKKKKEKKKKRKKHKKHKKHKHKKSQEDENEDDSNTDHETQDDELTSRTPESRSNILEEERELELREKAILSLKTTSK